MLNRELSIDTVEGLLTAHGARLRSLIGRTITATWAAWHMTRDEWFPEEAVIVDVGETSVEIVCWKLSDIALSWNEIDKSQPPQWVAEWGADFSLEWRRDAVAALRNAVAKRILGINVVEYLFRTTVVDDRRNPANVGHRHEEWLLHGLEFELEGGTLEVFNALDENGVESEPFVGEEFRRISV